ncbi:MAG TPA: D-2-hydroxyacid dehydrogenase [Steroidobacteraceae bacterium]|nr:D-2-hydroxyacid dehydrogenase [Steroidobacteraceae bacterium]
MPRTAFLAGCLLAACLASADETTVDPSVRSPGLIDELGLESAAQASRDHPRWRPPRRIVVRIDTPERVDWLQQAVPGVEIVGVQTAEEALSAVPSADVVIGFCSPEIVAAGDELRWIQVLWAGVESCVAIEGLAERNVILTNMQRVAGPVRAEHVFAMLLGLTRGLDAYLEAQRSGEWQRDAVDRDRMRSLRGKTMLVVGLGGIGGEVARLGDAFGMEIIATRASGRHGPDYVSYVGLPGELAALASRADVVVNTAPLTPETTGMFDREFFARVKPGAYFINVGRGRSVETDALVDALASGRLSGAGLDVTDPEPLPAGHALWSAPNVIITPHVSAAIDTGSEDRWRVVRENLARYAAGEPLLSVVDIERGY